MFGRPLSGMFRRASRTTHDADLQSANQLPEEWRLTVEDCKSSVSSFRIRDPEQWTADSEKKKHVRNRFFELEKLGMGPAI